MRGVFFAALLIAARSALADAPPPEVLEKLDLLQSYAEVSNDALWKDFDVVSSTVPVGEPADADKKTEEAAP